MAEESIHAMLGFSSSRRHRKRTLRHKCQGNLMNMAESPVNNCLQFLFTLHFKYGARRKAQVLIYSSRLRPGISFGHSQTKRFVKQHEIVWAENWSQKVFMTKPFSHFFKSFQKSYRKSFKQTLFIKKCALGSFNRLNPKTELYYLSQHRFCAEMFFPACFFLNSWIN